MDSSTSPPKQLRGILQLTGSLVAIAVLWLGIFPWLANQPAMSRQIKQREELGIEMGAMFYTDLEVVPDIEANLDRFKEKYPHALWNPWSDHR